MFLHLCVILFTGGSGWLPTMHHRSHDQGVYIEGGLGRPPQDTWDTTGYGEQVGSTHPTGMHCGFIVTFKLFWNNICKLIAFHFHKDLPFLLYPKLNPPFPSCFSNFWRCCTIPAPRQKDQVLEAHVSYHFPKIYLKITKFQDFPRKCTDIFQGFPGRVGDRSYVLFNLFKRDCSYKLTAHLKRRDSIFPYFLNRFFTVWKKFTSLMRGIPNFFEYFLLLNATLLVI